MTTYSAQPRLTPSGVWMTSAITSRNASTAIAAMMPTDAFCLGSRLAAAISAERSDGDDGEAEPQRRAGGAAQLREVGALDLELGPEAEQVHEQTEYRDGGEQDERQLARTSGGAAGACADGCSALPNCWVGALN